MGQPQRALEFYLSGIELLEGVGELWIVRPAYAAIAEVYASLGKWRDAATYYKQQAQAEAAIKETVLDGYIKNLETLLELNQTRRIAEQDMLTGILNRRGLETQLATLFEAAEQTEQPLTVVMADADHFKHINDHYSHMLGDSVLKELAQIIQASCRPGDAVARFGGEEFTVVMHGIAGETARKRCEQIRKNVAEFDWESLQSGLRVTISVGWADSLEAQSAEQLLEQADARLLEAKRNGRNQVVP
jgi:diguanylate cyclase (GGDEF)-like protein